MKHSYLKFNTKDNSEQKQNGNEEGACSSTNTMDNVEAHEYEKTATLKVENKERNTARYVDLQDTILNSDDAKKKNEGNKVNDEESKNAPLTPNETGSCTIIIQKKENSRANSRHLSILEEKELKLVKSENWMKKFELPLRKMDIFKFACFCCESFLNKIDNFTCYILLTFICITEIFLGFEFLNECPKQHLVPIHLFISGMFGLIISCFSVFFKALKHKLNLKAYDMCSTLLLAMNWVFCGWYAFGFYLIYSIAFPKYTKSAGFNYCNPIVYGLGFLVIHLWFIVCVCLIATFVLSMCYYLKKKDSMDTTPEPEKNQNPNPFPLS